MSKTSKKSEFSPIVTNLIRQNCYVRESVPSSSSCSSPSTYVSLDEIVVEDGVKLRESVNDYPITPDFVNSFSDSVDYRRDPVSAIAHGSKRTNLGDVSNLQKVCSMDMTSARELYDSLSKVFSSKSSSTTADSSSDVPSTDNK